MVESKNLAYLLCKLIAIYVFSLRRCHATKICTQDGLITLVIITQGCYKYKVTIIYK